MKFRWKVKIFIFLTVFYGGYAESQTNDECRVYLNFSNNYSFEIYSGFPQLYKIGLKYSLFSKECLSFLNLLLTKPGLNKLLLDNDNNACNFYYERFFNRCRCDTTSLLYIYKYPKRHADIEKKADFDKKIFEFSLLEIRDSALNALRKAYPKYYITIDVNSAIRSMTDQEKYFIKGSSKTLFSAHLLGAAADFTIFFNGILIDPKPKSTGLFKSSEPYQILGKFILDKDYFWGIPWDPGHMQLKRKFEDILLEYPDLQNDGSLIATYCAVIKSDSIPLKYKAVIEILDNKFGCKETRKYNLSVPWVEDTLLAPIVVDSLFKPTYSY